MDDSGHRGIEGYGFDFREGATQGRPVLDRP